MNVAQLDTKYRVGLYLRINIAQLDTWYRVGLHSCLNTTQLDTRYRVGIHLSMNEAQLDTKYRVGLHLIKYVAQLDIVTRVGNTVPDRRVVRSRRQADCGGERGLHPWSHKERHVLGRVEQVFDRIAYG